MKFIKGLLTALLALLAIWVILALFSSKGYDVQREITTEASPAQIWSQISTFENWQNWSPWKAKDSTLKSTYEGAPGTIGSKTSWVGNPDLSGTGNMTINEVIPNSKLGYDLQFGEFSSSKGFIEVTEVDGKSKIVWNDKGDLPFMMRPMALFGMFDKMMGPDFEAGLASITKLAVSSNVSASNAIEVGQVELGETKFLGIRHKTTMSEVMKQEFFASNYAKIFEAIGKDNIQMAGNSSCIYYSWNEEDSTTEAFPCVSVTSSLEKSPQGMEIVSIPACKAVKGTFTGSFEGAIATHTKIDEYCKANNLKTGLVYEEYVNAATAASEDEMTTNIFYLIIE